MEHRISVCTFLAIIFIRRRWKLDVSLLQTENSVASCHSSCASNTPRSTQWGGELHAFSPNQNKTSSKPMYIQKLKAKSRNHFFHFALFLNSLTYAIRLKVVWLGDFINLVVDIAPSICCLWGHRLRFLHEHTQSLILTFLSCGHKLSLLLQHLRAPNNYK